MKTLLQPILETYFRVFKLKSPKYFLYIRYILGALIAIFACLTYMQDSMDIVLPKFVAHFTGFNGIGIMGAAWVMSLLPVDNPDKLDDKLNR